MSKSLVISKDVRDKAGFGIPAGARVFIDKELHNPITGKEEVIILIDNGTGIKELFPKTLIEKEVLLSVVAEG